MGPAAWAAVGRALGVALAASAFGGRNSLPAILAEEVQQAIARHDLEMAAAVLRDLAYRNRTVLDDFLKKYGDELPAEVKEEILPQEVPAEDHTHRLARAAGSALAAAGSIVSRIKARVVRAPHE